MPPQAGRTEPEAAAAAQFHQWRGGAVLPAGMRLDARIHSGAVFEVWRGRLPDGTACAIKLPRRRHRNHPGAAAWLRREHDVLAACRHPHIVRRLGLVERDACNALAMEYLPGGDLVSLAGSPPRHWARAALEVVSALDAVHRQGYVHGDVKARNVLFDSAGRAKLADFGSALRIGRPLPAGGRTRAHEPLRFALARAEPAGDVYALAVLLYELMSGRLPYGAEPAAPTEAVPGWPPPGRNAPRALAALGARVVQALGAAGPADIGTLMEFADVLESVHCAEA